MLRKDVKIANTNHDWIRSFLAYDMQLTTGSTIGPLDRPIRSLDPQVEPVVDDEVALDDTCDPKEVQQYLDELFSFLKMDSSAFDVEVKKIQ